MKIIIRKVFIFVILAFCYAGKCSCNEQTNNCNIKINDKTKIQTAITNNKLKNKKIIRILSLDGGGTRGYIQVKFLEKFCSESSITDLGEYFDLIVGTSIGGITAVLLADSMKPSDLVKFFREKSPWIFTIRSIQDVLSNNASITSKKPNKLQMLYMISTGKPFYKSVSKDSNYGDVRLRKELQSIFNNRSLTDLNTKVLLPAYDFINSKPIVFSNAKLHSIFAIRDVRIVEAAIATSGFPVYFSSSDLYKTQCTSIADGGLFQCNPSILAFIAAKELYPSADKYYILSIGTGIKKINIDFDNGKKKHVKKSSSIIYNLLPVKYIKIWNVLIQNSKITNDILLNNISNSKDSNVYYYRFDIDLDINKDCSFDTSTKEFFDYLDEAVESKYKEDNRKIKQFIKELKYNV